MMDFDQEYIRSRLMKYGGEPLDMVRDEDGMMRYVVPSGELEATGDVAAAVQEERMLPPVEVIEKRDVPVSSNAKAKPTQQGQMELGFPVSGVNAKIRDAQNQLYSTGEAKKVYQTNREKIARFLQSGFEGLGMDRYKARNRAESLIGGDSGNLPLGMGVADFIPFLGTLLQTEEAAIMGGDAIESAKRGEIKQAALEAGGAALGFLPGGVATAKTVQKIVKKAKK
jgi:hypothetical protein